MELVDTEVTEAELQELEEGDDSSETPIDDGEQPLYPNVGSEVKVQSEVSVGDAVDVACVHFEPETYPLPLLTL